MKCIILVENCVSPPTDTLVHWLRFYFAQAPKEYQFEVAHQAPPDDTMPGLKDRLRIAARESESVLKRSEAAWAAYVIATTIDIQNPADHTILDSVGILILSIRSQKVEWLFLIINEAAVHPKEIVDRLIKEHREVVGERQLDAQQSSRDEEILRNTILQGIRLAVRDAVKSVPPASGATH